MESLFLKFTLLSEDIVKGVFKIVQNSFFLEDLEFFVGDLGSPMAKACMGIKTICC